MEPEERKQHARERIARIEAMLQRIEKTDANLRGLIETIKALGNLDAEECNAFLDDPDAYVELVTLEAMWALPVREPR